MTGGAASGTLEGMRGSRLVCVAALGPALIAVAPAAAAWDPPRPVPGTARYAVPLGADGGLVAVGDGDGIVIEGPDGRPERIAGPAAGAGAGSYDGGGGAFAVGEGGRALAMAAGIRPFEGDDAPLTLALRDGPGGPFGVTAQRTNRLGVVQSPAVAVGAGGRAIAVWRSFGRGGELDAIRAVVREPGGQFGEVQTLAVGQGSEFGGPPRVAALADGAFEVVFSRGQEVLLARLVAGATPEVSTLVSTDPDNRVRDLAYDVAPDGRAVLLYDAPPAVRTRAINALYAMVRPAGSAAFGSPQELLTTTEFPFDAQVGARSGGGDLVAALHQRVEFGRVSVVALRLDAAGRPGSVQTVSRPERYRGPLPRRLHRSATELELAGAPDGGALLAYRSGCAEGCGSLVHAAAARPGARFGAPEVISGLAEQPFSLRAGTGPGTAGAVLWSSGQQARVARTAQLAPAGPGAAIGRPPRAGLVVSRAALRQASRSGRLIVGLRCDVPCTGTVTVTSLAARIPSNFENGTLRVTVPRGGVGRGAARLPATARRALARLVARGPVRLLARVSGARGDLTVVRAVAR